MTETPGRRASTRKTGASTSDDEQSATAPSADLERTVPKESGGAAGDAAPAVRTPITLTIRLPFFTATFTGPGSRPPAGAPLSPVVPVAGRPDPGGMLEKMVFYGGVAAAGALGALEWPVAAAVAAGTWVAQHTPPPAGLLRATRPPTENRKPAEPEPLAVTSRS